MRRTNFWDTLGDRRATRRQALGLASAGTAAAIAAACGGSKKSSNAPSAGQAGKPQYGGQLNLRISVDPIDYDISYNGKTTPGDQALGLAYSDLLAFKVGAGVPYAQTTLVPSLAEKWEASPDATSFTFHLRQGVKFANLPPVNGRVVTADDVKFTFEYVARIGQFANQKLSPSPVGYIFEGIDRVDAPDASTAVVHFQHPFVPFTAYTASNWNGILPHEIYDQDNKTFKDKIIGSGPFQLDPASVQKGSSYTWQKNQSYWNTGQPYVDTIRWLEIVEDSSAFAAFQSKQVDVLEGLAFPSYQLVQRANPQAKFFQYLQPLGYHLFLSQAHPGPLTDLRVRQALALSVDRDEINKVNGGSQGQWAMPGAMQGMFTDAEARQMQKQDVQVAKQLLSAAGYANGVQLHWPIESGQAQDEVTMFQLVQAQAKRAGFDILLEPLEKAAQRAKRRKGDFDIDVALSAGTLEADPDSTLYGTFHTGSKGNYPKVSDPVLDKLLEDQRAEIDPAKRLAIQRNASKRILDQAWGVELIYPPKWDVAQTYVANYNPHFSVRAPAATVWLTNH